MSPPCSHFIDGQQEAKAGPGRLPRLLHERPLCAGGGGALSRPHRRRRSFYGTWLVSDAEESPHLSLGKVKGELYIACAEHDELAPLPMVEELRGLFAAPGSPGEIELYPGVHHGFAFPNAGATTSRPPSGTGSG